MPSCGKTFIGHASAPSKVCREAVAVSGHWQLVLALLAEMAESTVQQISLLTAPRSASASIVPGGSPPRARNAESTVQQDTTNLQPRAHRL